MIKFELNTKDSNDIIDILISHYESYKDRHNSVDTETALKAKRLAKICYEQQQEQLTK
jgi:hypothetical protein